MKRVLIQLDRERELRFDGMALPLLERASGISIARMMQTFAEKDLPMHLVLAMLYAGLQHEMRGVPEDAILILVDKHGTGDSTFTKVMNFAEPCLEALVHALALEEKKTEERLAPTQPNGTGEPTSGSATSSA